MNQQGRKQKQAEDCEFPCIEQLLNSQPNQKGNNQQQFRIAEAFLTGNRYERYKSMNNCLFVYNHPYEEDQTKKYDKAKQRYQVYARQYAGDEKTLRGQNKRALYAWNRILPTWTLETSNTVSDLGSKKQLIVNIAGNETPCLAHGQLGWINRVAKAHSKYVPINHKIETDSNLSKRDPKFNKKYEGVKSFVSDPLKVKLSKTEKDIKVEVLNVQASDLPGAPCIKATSECLSTVCALGLGLPTYATHIGVRKTTQKLPNGTSPYSIEFFFLPGSGAYLQTHAENFSQRPTGDSYRTAILETLVSLSVSNMFVDNNTGKRQLRVFSPIKGEKSGSSEDSLAMNIVSPSVIVDCPVPATYEKETTVSADGVETQKTETVPVGVFSVCESHNFIIDDAVPWDEGSVSSQTSTNISTSSQWLSQLKQNRESTVFIDAIKQNSYMVMRYALQCIFSGISECKMAIVVPDTRSVDTGKGHANYSIAYVRTMTIGDLTKMLNLSESQVFGIIETLYSLFMNLSDGEYILTKEAYDQSYYIFSRDVLDIKKTE